MTVLATIYKTILNKTVLNVMQFVKHVQELLATVLPVLNLKGILLNIVLVQMDMSKTLQIRVYLVDQDVLLVKII